ncbi:MAG TPA: alpha-1,4-glucan--maltose-1-phosphate maltosyltransferase [Candidatus Binatia bacterium]|nr:alpha-1,4-glucan--maltose-1-phosphate maltosyltransferase [Candidatus Binatia bacterium]
MKNKQNNDPGVKAASRSVAQIVADGRQRVVIDAVRPVVDGGRFAIKRVEGERVVAEADIFADGHDELSALLLYRRGGHGAWAEVPMEPSVNDVWRAQFFVNGLGDYYYTVQAWVDRFRSWRSAMAKKLAAQQEVGVDRLIGAELVSDGARRARGGDRKSLERFAAVLRGDTDDGSDLALADELADLMVKYPDRRRAVTYEKELRVTVERQKARCSAWYEIFPRSCAAAAGAHGTFKDCMAWLPYVASMGFDVLYLPPIHPIGISFRKGKNNATNAEPDDVGSPWAIGAKEGGHKAIHPQLGTPEDFHHFVDSAKEHGLEIAMDIAFQCTPDHPYVQDHPQWFRRRPDGSIQHAENPPKKYQDIYPIDFESDDWEALWQELKSVIEYWCEQGVRIFRVDNPHTKAIPFWQWVIGEVQNEFPDTIFLAEAFTRPKVMYRLAKVGFSQSYTYFAWRNTKSELTEYFTELTGTEVREYFRPNLWPNTPDILTEYLQFGGRPAFMARLVLAATLGANYGIYGPAFELCENIAREPGSEEYLDSEKYQIRHWDIARSDSLKEFIARVNRIRRENSALQSDGSLRFHAVDNDEIICFSKQTDDLQNVIVVVVALDPHHSQSGWVELSTRELGLDPREPYQMHELLTGARFLWHGARNYVQIDPQSVPAQIFRVRSKLRREQDFDYFF